MLHKALAAKVTFSEERKRNNQRSQAAGVNSSLRPVGTRPIRASEVTSTVLKSILKWLVARGQHGGDVMTCAEASLQVREGLLGRARQSRAATDGTSMCPQPHDSGDQARKTPWSYGDHERLDETF